MSGAVLPRYSGLPQDAGVLNPDVMEPDVMTVAGAAAGVELFGPVDPTSEFPLSDAVTAEVRAFFAERRPGALRVGPAFNDVVGALEEFIVHGGKRMRPTFAWWGWQGAGGDPARPGTVAVVRVCAALELIQACALIHDDLMDASATRRGRPSVHVAYESIHRAHGWRGDADRFGLATSVLMGDVALAWADDMVRWSGVDADAWARAWPVWEAMRTEVLGGQFLDVDTEVRGDESPESAVRTARFKTAAYTVERPLLLGAALAGGPDATAVARAYRNFGTDVGIAFQLRDDLLGVFGDPLVTGKPAGDDLREGKRTLLVALALRAADEKDTDAADAIRAGLGTNLTPTGVDELRAHLVRLGAVDAVEQRITELTRSGVAALQDAPVQPGAAAQLRTMAAAATARAR